jgi:hypothetical protein
LATHFAVDAAGNVNQGGQFMSGKIVMLTIGVAGVVAAGIVAAPRLVHQYNEATVATAAPAAETPATLEQPTAHRSAPPKVKATMTAPAKATAIKASDADLQARLKPVLNRGAHMDIAAKGFKSGEQFAAVAHAARNTQIPFMVLKHRVVDEHKTLAQAIRASRRDLNVKHEIARARQAARSDIATISG